MTAIFVEISDFELLQDHLAGSPEAFPAIVARHIDMVYSAARRQVRDAHLAEDVSQAVFMLLAKKAPGLSSTTILSAWLYRATQYCSANALRMAANRLRHERRAGAMMSQTIESESQSDWNELSPLLDKAINRLGEKDRQAVVLRYLQGKSTEAVAADMGLTLAAARKRIERAIIKLRNLLARSGGENTVPGLAALLSIHAIEHAPQHLITTIPCAIGGTSATSAASLAIMKGATTMIFWTQFKTVAAITALGLAITAGAAIAVVDNTTATAAPAAIAPAAPALSARQTLIRLAGAIKKGEVDYIKDHISWSSLGQKMVVDNQARTCESVAKFRQAYGEAFGTAALDQLPEMVGPTEVPASIKVTETGDTATADFGPGAKVPMVRQNGIWKLDYSSLTVNAMPLPDEQLAAYLNRTLVAMDEVTLGLQLGKYKTPNDCLAALRTLTIQAAHEPTTQSTK